MNARRIKKYWIPTGLVAGASAVAAFAATMALGVGTSASNAAEPHTAYPTNATGKTFGSAANAESPAQEPDLVLVTGNSGKEGYVSKIDLDGPEPQSLDDVKKYMASGANKRAQTIPVFDSSGKTQIDTFTIQPTVATEVAGDK